MQEFDAVLAAILAGQIMVGICTSFTVTVKAQVLVLPAPSVTLNVLVVTPTGNAAPDAKPEVCTVVGPEQLSVPTGAVKTATALHCPVVLFMFMFNGQVMLGKVWSDTVTVKAQVAVFAAPSVAVIVTVVAPRFRTEPTAGLCVTVGAPQLSFAVVRLV